MKTLKVGNIYTLNEDIKELWYTEPGANTTPIKAGAKCKLLRIDGEYISLGFETGQKVRTLTRMID